MTVTFPQPHSRFRQTLVVLVLLALPLAYLPLSVSVLAASAVTGAVVLIRAPWLIWPALGLSLPFIAGVRVGPASGSDVLLALAIGLWFADSVRRRTVRIQGFVPVALGLLYTLALLIATLTAVQLGEASKEVLKWTEFALILLILPQMITSARVPWLVGGVVAGALLQAGLGLYQFVFQIGPDWFIILGRFMRASGSFRQPNPFAGYLGLVLPVVVSLAVWAWGSLWSGDRGAINAPTVATRGRLAILTVVLTLAAGIIGAGLLASWSRGGWLGAVAGVGTVLIFRSRRSFALSLVLTTLVLTALLLGSFNAAAIPAPLAARLQDLPAYLGLTDVLNQPVTDENFAVVERLAHWVAAVRMWEQAPWLGVGPGNYAVVYPEVRLPRWEDPLGHAHNVYLNVLAESGLVGLFAYAALWTGTAAWVMRRQRAASAGSWWNALALGVLGVLVHLSVHNFFDNLYVQGMVILLALWLATIQLIPDAAEVTHADAADDASAPGVPRSGASISA